jgi:hypothetical protein
MKRLLYKLIFLVCIMFSGCTMANKEQETEKLEIQNIDFTVKEQKCMKLSQFFNSVKYVQLELSEESTIGNISKIQDFEERLYVLDGYVAKAVLVFTKEGKYIMKFGIQGKGRGEFRFFIRDFNIVEDKVYLLVDHNRVFIYNTKGDFIKEHRLSLTNIRSFFFKNGKWIFITSGLRGQPETK